MNKLTYTNSLTGEIFGPIKTDLDSYAMALDAAGCKVHLFDRFGSYQGRWVAKVTMPDGRQGWISDCYGSCSGCDAFESENLHDNEAADFAKRVTEFGRQYLDQFLTQAEMEAEASTHARYSLEDEEMLTFVRSNGWPNVLPPL